MTIHYYFSKLDWSINFLLILSVLVSAAAIFINLQASIRLDEAQSLWASTKTIPGILEYIAQDVHVPLYSLLLSFWMKFFGTDIMVIRLLSVLFFVASVPALYVLARKTASQKVAVIATSMFCLSPFLTWYSTESRMYTLLTFWTILSHLSFLSLFRSNARENKVLYVVVSILGMYSHYFFAMIIGLQSLYYIFKVWQARPVENLLSFKKWKESLNAPEYRGLIKYSVLVVGVIAAFLPWALYVVSQGGAANTQPLLSKPTAYNILQIFVHFFTGFQSATVQSTIISLWPLFVVLLFLTFTHKKKLLTLHTDYYLLVTFVPILIAFTASYVLQPMLVSRYLIFITPTFFYLLAILLSHFNKFSFIFVLSVVILSNFFFQTQQAVSSQIAERENYTAVAEYLSATATESDIIAVSVPFTVYPLEYKYQGRAKIETIPQWNRYTAGSIPEFTLENLDTQIETYQQQYQRMFLLLSYDQGYEDQVSEYMDANLHMNNKTEFSPGLELREYQLAY